MFKILHRILSHYILISFLFSIISAEGHEVLEKLTTAVIIRNHPKTGKPYVCITSVNEDGNGVLPQSQGYSRPDYRMLDPKVKSGEIPYDGPYSDSKRIYIFAASLATLGTVGGALGIAAVPATASASGGGAAYIATGSAVLVGSGAAGSWISNRDSESDDFTQESGTKRLS